MKPSCKRSLGHPAALPKKPASKTVCVIVQELEQTEITREAVIVTQCLTHKVSLSQGDRRPLVMVPVLWLLHSDICVLSYKYIYIYIYIYIKKRKRCTLWCETCRDLTHVGMKIQHISSTNTRVYTTCVYVLCSGLSIGGVDSMPCLTQNLGCYRFVFAKYTNPPALWCYITLLCSNLHMWSHTVYTCALELYIQCPIYYIHMLCTAVYATVLCL